MASVASTPNALLHAVWDPGWYNLDHSLVVGEADEYWFHTTPPDWGDRMPAAAQGGEPIFFNSILFPNRASSRTIRVEALHHPELGELTSIKTERFGVYEFTERSGRVLEVEAEQGPGVCYDPEVRIDDWSVRVVLSDAATSAPKPTGFRLAISRATHRDGLTLADYDAAKAARAQQPWWVRLFTKPPADSPVVVHSELTGDVFDVLTEALTAAERLANSMKADGDRVCVVVLDSEDTEVGGFWPGGGGSI